MEYFITYYQIGKNFSWDNIPTINRYILQIET